MKKVKVLVIQYKPIYLKMRSNLRKFETILKRYNHVRPDLVIFPEYSLTGPLYAHYDLSFKKGDKIFKDLSSLALKYKVNLIPGSFVKKAGGKKYNSTCFIDSLGKILGFYDKQYLWATERVHLSPGNKTSLLKTDIGNISIQICADLNSSRISVDYRKLKPDLIVNIAMWSFEDINACVKMVPKNIELLQTEYLARARAIENRAYMIFCNYADNLEIQANTGRTYKETSIGNSMIVNPYGEVIARTTSNKEEVIFSEIDISKTHWAKYSY